MNEAWGKKELSAEVGREETIHLIVQRDEPADPAAGVNQDELLLDIAAGRGQGQVQGPAEPAVPANAIYLRFWTNRPCIVIGRGYARRLPRLVERVGELPVLIRASGGEVVIHAPGVLNVAVALPTSVWTGSIDEAFAVFADGIVLGLRELGVAAEVREIPDSYCPGRYDIAIQGKKIMGTSQRRTREALLVHGSLNVAVEPEWIADHLQAFYRAAHVNTRVDVRRISSLHKWTADVDSEAVEQALIAGVRSAWSERVGRHIVTLPPGAR